jgi:IS4 transposase
MQIRADYHSPVLVKFTDATTHDSSFMQDIEFTRDQIYVFDKGYNDYERFESFNANQIPFVTRLKHNAAFRRKKEFELAIDSHQAILLDEQIVLPMRENGKIVRGLPLRRVVYWDQKHQVCYEFISNIYELSADQVTQIYKSRWQIETLHKQLKQNQSLSYFLGDNVNAIIIQIWCALIWNLLLTVLQRQIKAKSWAFSNLASVIRLHLFNYIQLNSFLKNPEKHYHRIVKAELILFDG